MGDEPMTRNVPTRRRTLGFVVEMLRLNLMSGMAYRASFLAQVVFMMLNNSFFLVFWWLFFNQFRAVGNWQMHDMLVLFGMSAVGFGLGVVLCGNALRLSTLIQEGHLDYYLALPPDPLLHILTSRMIMSGIGDVIFGLLIFGFFVPFDPWHWAIIAAVVPLSAVVFVSFCVISHSLAFFMGGAEGVSRFLFEALLTFSMYPESLFSGWVKVLLFTLVPAGFVTYVPASLLREFSWSVFGGLLVFTVGIALGARALFNYGLRRYESGNLIAARQ